MCWEKINKNDAVKHCIIFKSEGCSHVDGYLCNYETCRERIKAENETNRGKNNS